MAENDAGFSSAAAKIAASDRNDTPEPGLAMGERTAGATTPLHTRRVATDTAPGAVLDPDAARIKRDPTGSTYLVQRDARPWLLFLSLIAVLLDRLTKVYVSSHLQLGQAVTVIPGFFRITHVLNFGAAFSMFAESASPDAVRWSLVIFSTVVAALVFGLLWKMGRVFSPGAIGLALILGGAVGNLYDRMKLHYVVDFLEVHIVHYHWPDFNVADSCITVGAVLLLIELLWPKPKQTHLEDVTAVVE